METKSTSAVSGTGTVLPELSELDDDLLSLASLIPGRLECAEILTPLSSPVQRRASYRLRFSGEVVVKARRFKTIDRARGAAELAPLLRDLPFNRVIAVKGDWRLEEWVEGEVLQPHRMDDDLARWAGDLLGRLHSLPCRAQATPVRDVCWHLEKLRLNIGKMAKAGNLARTTAEHILQLAADLKPPDVEVGLIHGDFCGENIVIDRSGNPIAVDNEHITLGALDYDLVKCWYRWPMTPSQRLAFRESYQLYRSTLPAIEHFRFWSICSLANSARIRAEHGRDLQPSLQGLLRVTGARC